MKSLLNNKVSNLHSKFNNIIKQTGVRVNVNFIAKRSAIDSLTIMHVECNYVFIQSNHELHCSSHQMMQLCSFRFLFAAYFQLYSRLMEFMYFFCTLGLPKISKGMGPQHFAVLLILNSNTLLMYIFKILP